MRSTKLKGCQALTRLLSHLCLHIESLFVQKSDGSIPALPLPPARPQWHRKVRLLEGLLESGTANLVLRLLACGLGCLNPLHLLLLHSDGPLLNGHHCTGASHTHTHTHTQTHKWKRQRKLRSWPFTAAACVDALMNRAPFLDWLFNFLCRPQQPFNWHPAWPSDLLPTPAAAT